MANTPVTELSPEKIDAIGEIHNITMGAAATAVSNLLNAKVWITTPQVSIGKAKEQKYPTLEPAIHIKIEYIKGISGSSLLILKQSDVQMILNQLMGMPLVLRDDFEFDEMNISAVCEVMNQMMGASSTALSKLIDTVIDISTPEAVISNEQNKILELKEVQPDDYVCSISFNLTIDGVINSEFITILTLDLANEMAERMLKTYNDNLQTYSDTTNAAVEQVLNSNIPSVEKISQENINHQELLTKNTSDKLANSNLPNHTAESPVISPLNSSSFSKEQLDNLKLMMNVPLNVTVKIGSAQEKVKDLLEYSKGTIIELDKHANEPVDVIVNGNLIAKGDVVVVDDSFAVRITEIINSKLFDTLGSKE